MKGEAEVQDRIRYLLTQELDRRVENAAKRLPLLCSHNHRHTLDPRKQVNGGPNEGYNRIGNGSQTIGLCMLDAEDPTEWKGDICEDPIDAQRCQYFDPKVDKDHVWAEFNLQIKKLDWVQENMPEVYGLLWALGSNQAPPIPWWKVLWFKFLKIQVEPLVQVQPPQLPETTDGLHTS